MNILVIRICGHISGAEVYNFILLKEFKKYSDIKLSFITNLDQFAKRVSEFNSKVICLPILGSEVGTKKGLLLSILFLPCYWIIYLLNIYKLETEAKFDLVCLQSMTEKIFLSPLLRLFCYKILWIEHGPLFVTSRSKIIKILYKFSSVFVHKIVAVSNDTREDLINGGLHKEKIIYIPIGVDIDYFKPYSKLEIVQAKKELEISQKVPVIVYVGSVTKEKGIREFIKLCEDLINVRPDLHILVVGDGPLLNSVKYEVNEKGFESRFMFAGFVRDVRNYLAVSDIFVFPSKHDEGLSIALLEALSMGVLVMASNKRGNLELIKDMRTGYIFDDQEIQKVKSQILCSLDDQKRNLQIKKNARLSVVKRYNIKRQARKFISLFKSL